MTYLFCFEDLKKDMRVSGKVSGH